MQLVSTVHRESVFWWAWYLVDQYLAVGGVAAQMHTIILLVTKRAAAL
jgi:hypothetical protein